LAFFLRFLTLNRKPFFLRTLILSIFYAAFHTNSILVFYIIIPVLLIFYFKPKSRLDLLKIAFRFSDFMLLPIFFWIIKKTLTPTSGIFAKSNYNEITIENLVEFPWRILKTFKVAFLDLISRSSLTLFE